MVVSPVEPNRVEKELSIPFAGKPPAADHQCESVAPDTSGAQATISSASTAAGPQFSDVIVGASLPPPPQAAKITPDAAASANTRPARLRCEAISVGVRYIEFVLDTAE